MNRTRFANALTILLVVGSLLGCDEAVVGNDLDATSLSNNQGIACGDAVCNDATEMCCVSFSDDTYTSACLGQEETCEGTGLHWPLLCDGPEDCGGNACCGNLSGSMGVECSSSDSCPNDIGYYCQTSDDCPDGRGCLSLTFGEFPIRVCDDP